MRGRGEEGGGGRGGGRGKERGKCRMNNWCCFVKLGEKNE